MDRDGLQTILAKHPFLKDKLFARGFLLTNAEIDEKVYPFYGIWKKQSFGTYSIYLAKGVTCCSSTFDTVTGVLVGNAYDPFAMEHQEENIIERLLHFYAENKDEFWNSFNNMTGVFCLFIIHGDEVFAAGDPAGMLSVFYSAGLEKTYIASHANLIGDILKLEWDPYIAELVQYRFFKFLGNSLPGDLTQFKEVKRLVPNHYLIKKEQHLEMIRFYWPGRLDKSIDQIAEEAAAILHRNLQLIAKKWEKPAISLSGGCDSKTTLACANGLYERFYLFSYNSTRAEEADAEAAGKICAAIGQKHVTYSIPYCNHCSDSFKAAREILNWNSGNLHYINDRETDKRIFFDRKNDFDVEVKSWASEIGRAYYSKRFHGRMQFGDEPSPRKCTTLYKFFLHNRKLVKRTDDVFEEYLASCFDRAKENPIEWQEQFFWEFREASWNGLVITGEHRYSYDITIPYNNRKLLELLLSAPAEDRVKDTVYKKIRDRMNPAIDATGVFVTNLKHTQQRAAVENLYYSIHSRWPL